MNFRKAFITTFLTLFAVGAGQAQSLSDYLPDDVTYNAGIPTPSEILGYEIGEQHPDHALIIQYMHKVAAASDRVEIQEYARTYEHRPLVLLKVSSPGNIVNLEEIRQNHIKLTHPEQSQDLVLEQMPVLTWLGYSVHGNEPSGASTSMLAVYYLAAAEGEKIDRLLEESVILIDPVLNPDGLNRFASWVNSHRSSVMDGDPMNREHNEAWPGGRTNHYWFDLNRDWMPVVHPESRGRIKMYQQWKPNVLTDHHEMGTQNTYFFQPGVPARENPLIPEQTVEIISKLAKYHASYLDEYNQLYWTKEGFDNYYLGKGSTYPDLHGTIGILFEQPSARGHLQDSQHGKVSFPVAIRNQFVTTLSTIEGSHENRVKLLSHMRDFYVNALENARNDDISAYVFGCEKDPARNYHLIDILDHHNIDVYHLSEEIEQDGLTFHPDWAYIVPLEQPQYTYIKGLFMEHHEFTDSLFYDVSTWTLPHAFNMDYVELKQGGLFSRNFREDLLGGRVADPFFPQGELKGDESPYAYLFEWHGYYAPRAAYRLLDAGARLKAAKRPFRIGTQNGVHGFDYGTIMANMGIQDTSIAGEIHKVMEKIAEEDGIVIHTVETGLSTDGVDLGSRNFISMEKPSTMIIVGDGINMHEAGEVWHLLDQRYKMHHTLIDKKDINNTDLSRYNNIVMVNGNYNDICSQTVNSIKKWVYNGGNLITIKNATRWAVTNKLADIDFRETHLRLTEKGDFPPYIEESTERGALVIGGTIFETQVDLTHPLLYGYSRNTLPVFRNSRIFIEPTDNPYASPVRYTSEPLLSGYVSEKNMELLPESTGVAISSFGSGKVILMPDNPNFRGFWFGTNKLFANALFFGSGIEQATTN